MAIIKNSLSAALKKSCDHTARQSFETQINRLKTSGYPSTTLYDVVEKMINIHRQKEKAKNKGQRPAVIPYIHRVSHNMKKVAARYDIPVVFSAPDKLRKLCPVINSPLDRRNECGQRHKQTYIPCQSQVIYEIPFTCGRVYVGQSGRCVNTRLREHAASLNSTPSGHLAVHVRDCHCKPKLTETRILRRYREKTSREIYEAMTIKEKENSCVSAPSVALTEKELNYLNFPT